MDNELMQKEIAEFMRMISEKYFVSTWIYSVATHCDNGTDEFGEFGGSLPEAIGLCVNLQDHIKECRGTRE